MAGVSRIKHHTKAYRELVTSPEVQAELLRRAEKIADAAGEGHVATGPTTREDPYSPVPIRRRDRAAVVAVSFEAKRANSANNVLIRSIDAGR